MKEDQSERLVVVGVVRRVCAATIHTRVCASHTAYTPQQQQHTKKQSCSKPLLCAITRRLRGHITPATDAGARTHACTQTTTTTTTRMHDQRAHICGAAAR